MALVKRLLTLVLAFAAMVVGIEGIRRAVDWWHGTPPAAIDFVLIGCLPFIGWLWWRFASPFGKRRGQCLDGACPHDKAPR